MNYKMISRYIGSILIIEVLFMLPALLISLADHSMNAVWAFLISMFITQVAGQLLRFFGRGATEQFYAREGLICAGLCWILLSVQGCLPFVLSGEIPRFIDALFETVSGFTTTGASILPEVENLSRGILYWRSFSHWVGGMGVLVFLLALAPNDEKGSGFTMHLLRAESPGPDVSKLVPHMKDTAKILYLLYVVLTILDFFFLLIGHMDWFEAVCTAFGTAGTGGFGVRNDSIASYSPYIQNVCTVFMLLFGVNFSCYFLLTMGHVKDVLKDEELRFYAGIVLVCTVLITFNIRGMYSSLGETVRHAAFQVASIITTTGFATTNFDLWPSFSKAILLCLMLIGACAGSTGGGLKCGRALLLIKSLTRNVNQVLRPRQVEIVRVNGRKVEERVLRNTEAYLVAYVIIIVTSFLIVSLDNQSTTTNISAVISCFNNIGPGLEAVGPACNYGMYSDLSKLILILDMLAGRLEIFPMLVLFSANTWKKR